MYLPITMKRRLVGWTAVVEYENQTFKAWSTSYIKAKSLVREPVIQYLRDKRTAEQRSALRATRPRTVPDEIFINESTL